MKRSNQLACSIVSGLLFATAFGCSSGPAPGPSASTATPPGQTPPKPAPTQVAVATPTASPAAATPGATGTPKAGGTPSAAAAGAQAEGFDKASGQDGYEDVKKLGKNPFFGDAAATEKGKALFAANCASCHGDAGKGDGPAGAALDPKPRNFTNKAEYKYGTGDLAIFRTGKYGSKGTGMAGFDGRLSDDEIWQTVNYIKTLQGT